SASTFVFEGPFLPLTATSVHKNPRLVEKKGGYGCDRRRSSQGSTHRMEMMYGAKPPRKRRLTSHCGNRIKNASKRPPIQMHQPAMTAVLRAPRGVTCMRR